MDLDALYQEIILDHYRNPLHAQLTEPFDAEVHHVNPSCGDEVTLRVRLDVSDDAEPVVAEVSHHSVGCSISQASTSVMTEQVIGKQLSDAMADYETFLSLMNSRAGGADTAPDLDAIEEQLGDAVAFRGVAQFPARIKCALLGWAALRDATSQALSQAPADR